jgi:hypothetical protein
MYICRHFAIKVAAFSGYLQGDQTAAAKSVEEEE